MMTNRRPMGRALALSAIWGLLLVASSAQAPPRGQRLDSRRLYLRSGSIDPREEYSARPESDEDQSLFVVQYSDPVRGRDALRRIGARRVCYLPARADLVEARALDLAALDHEPSVRWWGTWRSEWRAAVDLARAFDAGRFGIRDCALWVTASDLAAKRILARRLDTEPHPATSDHDQVLIARLDAAAFDRARRDPQVLFIDPWSAPEPDVDQARVIFGADAVETVAGFTGAGVRGQVRDVGLAVNHPDFVSRPPWLVAGAGGDQVHGTAVWGILFSDGATNPAARGFLPDGQGIFFPALASTDRWQETANLLQPVLGGVFECSATGGLSTPDYTVASAALDQVLFDLDVCVLQSMGNSGYFDARPEAWAKNVISVGGVRHFDTLTLADDGWLGLASQGPAADLRIKPDLCAFNDFITTSCALPGVTTCGPTGHQLAFGGTSAACAIASGCVGLLHEIWSEGSIFGNPLQSWSAFDNRPSMTLAKALMIESTRPYPFMGPGADLGRERQGWGRPDLMHLLDRADDCVWIDESIVLQDQQSWSRTVVVPAGTTELSATLVFADPPGNPAAALARINDLDLRVTDPTGGVWLGNFGLDTDSVSQAGGVADDRDTVERVILNLPQAGTWTIEVQVAELNADGHVETPTMDVDFSLVVTGVQPDPAPPLGTGEPNHPQGSFRLEGALDAQGRRPQLGLPGPFHLARSAGEPVTFIYESTPNRPFLLLAGPVHSNNFLFTGVGWLDIGLLGLVPEFTDVFLLVDGVTPTDFLSQIANAGPSGRREYTFTMPALPPGPVIAFQAVFYESATGQLTMTAANALEAR
ncbi:MAG: S8 family serine peptidase [Planctomycetes bacterium]|nr:S8 family serine peptidase [Planctomycetota bacterium]